MSLQMSWYSSSRNVSEFDSNFFWDLRHKGEQATWRSKSLFHGVSDFKMSGHWRHTTSHFTRTSPSNCWKIIWKTSLSSSFDWPMAETLISDDLVHSEHERNPEVNGLTVSSIHSNPMSIPRSDAHGHVWNCWPVYASNRRDMTSLFDKLKHEANRKTIPKNKANVDLFFFWSSSADQLFRLKSTSCLITLHRPHTEIYHKLNVRVRIKIIQGIGKGSVMGNVLLFTIFK